MEVIHNENKRSFEVMIDGARAHADYVIENGMLDVRHTFVPDSLRGKGLAGIVVKAAFDYALEQGLIPVGTCSYAATWLERHPEYEGKKGKDYGGPGTCSL